MNKYKRVLPALLALFLGLALVGSLLTACSLFEKAGPDDVVIMGVTNFNSVTLSDDLVVGDDATIGGDVDFSGGLDMNGNKIDLDADADTSITADTDDQIDIEIGDADEYVFTAGVFDIGEGTLSRIDLDADGDTSIRSAADDEIQLEIGAADEYTFTATLFDVNANQIDIDLDADNDTSITADTDDQVDFEIGDSDEYSMTAASFFFNANVLELDADNDTSIAADTDDQIDIEIAGADDFQFTANIFSILAGSMVHPENATLEGVVFSVYQTMTHGVTSTVTSAVVPANADIVDWYLVISTAFNGGGADTLTCGIGTDADKWIDDLDISAVGRHDAGDAVDTQQDEWATSFGDVGASNVTVQCLYVDANNDSSAGALTFVLLYRLD